MALGAEDSVAWEYHEDTLKTIKTLRQDGFYIIAFEQDERSIDYKDVSVAGKENIVFVIGPEVTGISQDVLNECDVVAEIPMLGTKESLNVTIAFGVGVYRILGI